MVRQAAEGGVGLRMTSARELTTLVRRLHDVCEGIATGGQARYEDYEAARQGILEESSLASAMPGWLRSARTGSQYWAFIKRKFRTYADRREFLSVEFDPMFSVAEISGTGPVVAAVTKLSEAGTPESVQLQRKFAARVSEIRSVVDQSSRASAVSGRVFQALLAGVFQE